MSKFDRAARKLDRIARCHPPQADQVGAIAMALFTAMTAEERQRFIAMATVMEAETSVT